MEIFLDLDGLIADTISVMLHQCGLSKYRYNWPKGVYYVRDLFKLEGVEAEEAHTWKHVDIPNLYKNCVQMPDARRIVELVTAIDPEFHVCTACYGPHPRHRGDLIKGKIEWCQKFFGETFDRVIPIDDKSKLAAPHRLLIDDHVENVDKWREAGGDSFLYPRPWNDGNEENGLVRLEEFLKMHRTRILCPVCYKQMDLFSHPSEEVSDMGLAMLLGDSRRIHAAQSPECRNDVRWIHGCIREKVC